MALTKRRQLFVAEYVADPKIGAAKAAIKAGFSERRAKETACELMKDPEIKAAIEHAHTRRLEKLEINQNLVLVGILQTIEKAIAAGSGAWQMTTLLKAYELLGRHLKMFTDKVEIGMDEALIERLTAGRARAGMEPAEKAAPAIPAEVVIPQKTAKQLTRGEVRRELRRQEKKAVKKCR